MHYYYLFYPRPNHRVNAWKKTSVEINLTKGCGHQVQFPGRKISPVPLVLRHYIFLSAAHAQQKYGKRVRSTFEVEQLGWRRANRENWGHGQLILPPRSSMKIVGTVPSALDASEPQPKHLFSFIEGGEE
jgi:hypothetical protein